MKYTTFTIAVRINDMKISHGLKYMHNAHCTTFVETNIYTRY